VENNCSRYGHNRDEAINWYISNARFIVQREELGYAFVPLPDEEKPYFSPLMGETPSFLGTPFELIDGDVELFNGISVHLTLGHTPGSQSILISTTEGTYYLTGDNAFFYENIEKNILGGHIYSRADWFTSMNRIKRLAVTFCRAMIHEFLKKSQQYFQKILWS
jgi:glyoxylase-like metal-dependent hydrolase (beta-lactamase superfamily II)